MNERTPSLGRAYWLCGALFALGLLAARPIWAQTTLTLAHIVVAEHPRAKACQFFADTVSRLSQGRLRIEIFGNASIGDAASNLRALQNGTLDITANTQGPVAAVVPEFNAFGMPFLFPDVAAAWRVLDGPAGRRLEVFAEKKGLIVLGLWDNGIRHFSNNLRPLLKPADFIGLRIRTPPDPVTLDIVEALGAKSQQINFSDLYNALRLGVVDGQENPLINVKEARLYEFQKYLSLTGHKYEITPLLISKQSWEALAPIDRQVLLEAARQATDYQRALTRKAEQEASAMLVERGVRIDRVDLRPFVAATAKIYEKWYASPIGGYVREVVKAARERP